MKEAIYNARIYRYYGGAFRYKVKIIGIASATRNIEDSEYTFFKLGARLKIKLLIRRLEKERKQKDPLVYCEDIEVDI